MTQQLQNLQFQQQQQQQFMVNMMSMWQQGNQQQQRNNNRRGNNNNNNNNNNNRCNNNNNNRNNGGGWANNNNNNNRNNNSGGWARNNQNNWNAMPTCPPVNPFQGNQQFGSNGGGGNNQFNNNDDAKDPRRWYENREYCGTHGCHVENGHNSRTCTMPGPNHNFNATGPNDGGSQKDMHKTIMPSQCGRIARTRVQKAPTRFYLAWKAAGFPPKRQFNRTYQQSNNWNSNQPAPMYQNSNNNNGGGGYQPYAGMANQFGSYNNGGGNNQGFGWYMGRNF